MRMLAKFFLWIVGMAIPVVIAACYGPSMRYQKDGQPEGKPTGQVLDKNTRQPVAGLEVRCLSKEQVRFITRTSALGTFHLLDPFLCDQLQFNDLDGDANQGLHKDKQISYRPGPSQLVVELEPKQD